MRESSLDRLIPVWTVYVDILWDRPELHEGLAREHVQPGAVVVLPRGYDSEAGARDRLDEVLSGYEDSSACFAARVRLVQHRETSRLQPLVLAAHERTERGPWADVTAREREVAP